MRAGDESNGFSIQQEEGALRIRMWGFWEQELSALFIKALSNLQRSPPGALVVDLLRLKPQREAGQEALGALVALPQALGLAEAAAYSDNVLTRLQFARIAKEKSSNVWSCYRSEQEALAVKPKAKAP